MWPSQVLVSCPHLHSWLWALDLGGLVSLHYRPELGAGSGSFQPGKARMQRALL